MRPVRPIRIGAASEFRHGANPARPALSGCLLSLAFPLCVVALVVSVVAVPRAIARDPRRHRVEAAASAQRLHCVPHSLVHRLVHRFVRPMASPRVIRGPLGLRQPPLRSPVCDPYAKSHSPEMGKWLLNTRTLRRPFYGAGATSREFSLGMSPICTSDMAARERPRELPPSGQRNTRQ